MARREQGGRRCYEVGDGGRREEKERYADELEAKVRKEMKENEREKSPGIKPRAKKNKKVLLY